jgi:hypothetical protein
MSSFSADWSSYTYWLWNLAAFAAAIPLNSFIEWATHRFVMHRPFKLIPYGYLHTTSHHARFGADASYYASTAEDRDHILFTWKEYTLLPLFCLLAYSPIELLLGKPILIGVLAATFFGLQMFNSLHWRFHVPAETWFQRTRFFRFLKEHHRLHHEDMTKNFNVYFLPLADWICGTLITSSAGKK